MKEARPLSKADDLRVNDGIVGAYIDRDGIAGFVPIFRATRPAISGVNEDKESSSIHGYKVTLRDVHACNSPLTYRDIDRAPHLRSTELQDVTDKVYEVLCVLDPKFVEKLRDRYVYNHIDIYKRGKPVGYTYFFGIETTHLLKRFKLLDYRGDPDTNGTEHTSFLTGYIATRNYYEEIYDLAEMDELFSDEDFHVALPINEDTYPGECPKHRPRGLEIDIYEAYKVFPQLHHEPEFARISHDFDVVHT